MAEEKKTRRYKDACQYNGTWSRDDKIIKNDQRVLTMWADGQINTDFVINTLRINNNSPTLFGKSKRDSAIDYEMFYKFANGIGYYRDKESYEKWEKK